MIAAGCKQTLVLPVPAHPIRQTTEHIQLAFPTFTPSTSDVLASLGTTNLAHGNLQAAFSMLEQQLRHEPSNDMRGLAMAELAAAISRSAKLNTDEAIKWSRDAAVLATFCLSMTTDNSIWSTACSIHNQSLTRCLQLAGTRQLVAANDWPKRLETAGIHLSSQVSEWTILGVDRLELADRLTVTGITPKGRHAGFGVPLVVYRSLEDPPKPAEKSYGPEAAIFAATATIRSFAPMADWRSQPVEIILHNPLNTETLALGASSVPIAADLSTPLASRLSQKAIQNDEYLGVLDPAIYTQRAGAYAVDPYQPGKIPVVFVHGLWSSPKVWIPMLDALRADPTIRARYQFWVVLYPSGYPLPIAAQSLRKSLREIRFRFDPHRLDSALDQMVVVGKSTGGQVTRMLVQSSGQNLWNAVFTKPLHELKIPNSLEIDLASTFFYEPEPYIRTAVFIATAHRGGNLARQPIARLGVSLIRRNNPLRTAWNDLQAANHTDFIQPVFQKSPPTSLDGMRAGNPLLIAIDSQPISTNVTYHSIIASLHPDLPTEAITDGFVRYASAHLEGAASERLVTSSHLCEANPEVIAEMKRILLAQAISLSDSPISNRDIKSSPTANPRNAEIAQVHAP
jgi:pimeloyl-ACP methyl ester carboxylesterase